MAPIFRKAIDLASALKQVEKMLAARKSTALE
jgi:hypothetical protein